MAKYQFDWVDAFTRTPFGGNGCAVFYDAQDISIEQRLALVRETKLSECAFLVGSSKADFGVRYYLAGREILMAGHPTIATVRSLVHRGLINLSSGKASLTLEVGAGVLPIEVEIKDGAPLITMTQQRPEFGSYSDPSGIAEIYGLDASDVLGKPRFVSTGTPFCVCVLRSREALDRAVLDVGKLSEWQNTTNKKGMEPFLTILEGAEAGNTYSRLLLAPPSPAEDPFTGSATGCMAAYLWSEKLISSPCFVAEQGHGMGRPGQAYVEVKGSLDDILGVRVSGYGTVLMEGTASF